VGAVKALIRRIGSEVVFVLAEVDEPLDSAVRGLGFRREGEEYIRLFPNLRPFPSDVPQLERAFRRFERCAEEMVLQAARARPAPWDAALSFLLERVDGAGIDWWLTGSGALAVRGLAVTPRDVDLVTDAKGARGLGDLLADVLVEPVIPVTEWICSWWGRAFRHTRIEWVGEVSAEPHVPSDVGPAAEARLERVCWRGWEVLVPPLDLQLSVSESRGLTERVELIRRAM
jgi:hypothetical protein